MKNVIFIVHTEYHLIVSIGLIVRYFSDRDYNPIIYQISPIGGVRLNKIDTNVIPAEYRLFKYDYHKPNVSVRNKMDEIANLQPSHFVFFLEDKFWTNYLLSKLHKCGTKIILAPDGANVYENYRYGIKHRAGRFCWFLYKCLQAKMIIPLPTVEKYFGTNKYIDELWAEYPESHINVSGKKIFSFTLPQTKEYAQLLDHIFDFSIDANLFTKPSILFFDSGFTSEEYYEKVKEVLKFLVSRYPERILYVKCHQLTADKAEKEYGQIPGVRLLKAAYPAELYVINAVDSVLVSIYSSSMFVNNESCKYFFIYPLLGSIINAPLFQAPNKIKTCYTKDDLSVID